MSDPSPQPATDLSAANEIPNETRNETLDKSDLMAGFSIKQTQAFSVLTTGGKIADAARAAGVARKTIYEWLEPVHEFGSAYEQWKSSIAETSRTRLLMIGEAATVQIARAVRQGDTRAALAVAKGMGLLAPPPVGRSLSQTMSDKREADAKLAVAKSERARNFADLVNVDNFRVEMARAEEMEAEQGEAGEVAESAGETNVQDTDDPAGGGASEPEDQIIRAALAGASLAEIAAMVEMPADRLARLHGRAIRKAWARRTVFLRGALTTAALDGNISALNRVTDLDARRNRFD